MTYTPIQCQLYDYIEIACLRHYTLLIHLIDGNEVQGKAKTTKIQNKQEFLVINLETSQDTQVTTEEEISIRLDKIKTITALDKNAEFKTVAIT